MEEEQLESWLSSMHVHGGDGQEGRKEGRGKAYYKERLRILNLSSGYIVDDTAQMPHHFGMIKYHFFYKRMTYQ